ncbi:MAG: fibronectin type III domain-containing protein [Fibrobacter sp.]|nr:fibronectin type III domain-containing protein [Fibrobacter sp.]
MKNLCLVSMLFVTAISLNCSTDQKSENITKEVFDETSIDLQHICTANSIELAWDPPEVDDDKTDNDPITHYRLYYKTSKEQSSWIKLKDNIPESDAPQCVVSRDMVSDKDSTFWFAVSAVTQNNDSSELHWSEDSTASPTNWFVLWKTK